MNAPSDTQLALYVAGQAPEADARAIERWIAADPANHAYVAELRAVAATQWPPVAVDVDAMWAGVRRTMRTDEVRRAKAGRVFEVIRVGRWIPLAAAAAIAFVIGGVSFVTLHRSTAAAIAAADEPMREYVTPRGQRATFQLSDGTHLILAAASRLRVPASYGRGSRDVYLDGEALFEVVHDGTRPFRVHARDAVAEDLGTRFDVRAYADDAVVAVAVAEGVVALDRASGARARARSAGEVAQGVVLRAGDLGTIASDGRVTTATGPIVATYLGWAAGRLGFVDAPLPDVVRAIGRWYDLDVRVASAPLEGRTVTAEFEVQSADDAMRALALALDADVTRHGNVVTLRAKS